MSISGNLDTMPFADLLQWVSQSRKTGTLVLEGDPFTKKIYFRDGLVVAAASENPKEFLGYYFVGWGFVAEDELQELLDMQDRHNTMLGELLVIIGKMSREDLAHVLQVKTEEALYDLFLWETGAFRFLENVLPEKKFQSLDMPVDMIIMEGVRRQDEWERCRQAIPDVTWVPKVVHAVDVQQLGETQLRIFRRIDGMLSIEDIALSCRLPYYDVLEFVFQGQQNGLFEVRAPGAEEKPIPGFSQGMWRQLVKQGEAALKQGNLLRAVSALAQLREKHTDKREAMEHAAALEQRVNDLMDSSPLDESSVLELAIPLAELSKLECSPEEGFLLSRINGSYTLAEILAMVPGGKLENQLRLDNLLRRDVIQIQGN